MTEVVAWKEGERDTPILESIPCSLSYNVTLLGAVMHFLS